MVEEHNIITAIMIMKIKEKTRQEQTFNCNLHLFQIYKCKICL